MVAVVLPPRVQLQSKDRPGRKQSLRCSLRTSNGRISVVQFLPPFLPLLKPPMVASLPIYFPKSIDSCCCQLRTCNCWKPRKPAPLLGFMGYSKECDLFALSAQLCPAVTCPQTRCSAAAPAAQPGVARIGRCCSSGRTPGSACGRHPRGRAGSACQPGFRHGPGLALYR